MNTKSVERTFIFSCDVFSGYEVILNVTAADSFPSLAKECVNHLKTFLKKHKLDRLQETLSQKKYHIHDTEFEDIFLRNIPIYVCNCPQ
jgi:hypothetical protein